ncbi:MAG: lipoyl(octanoyl) transferase LipB [Tepidisphaerales bacterium]
MLPHRHLGRMAYRQAWAEQEAEHAAVVAGRSPGVVLTVEHPPVITLGRRAELSASHLRASTDLLAQMGVELVESDRGGDITFHGPGQLVAYPIVRLADFGLSVGGYVRSLQQAVMDVLEPLGLHPQLDPSAVGVWVPTRRGGAGDGTLAKVCAVGVRVKAGVTLHGLALNVTTDLRYFDLIVPCGLTRPVTSLAELLGVPDCPGLEEMAYRLHGALCRRLESARAERMTGVDSGQPVSAAAPPPTPQLGDRV